MKISTILKTLSAVGIFGTVVFSVNANADCASGITQSGAGWQSCIPTSSYGSSSNSVAYPATYPTEYGAVAVGFVSNMPIYKFASTSISRDIANRASVGKCMQAGGKQCRLSIEFTNACGSVASSSSNALYLSAGNSPSESSSLAVSNCKQDGATECKVVKTKCNGMYYHWQDD